VFDVLDTNGDGELTQEELHAAFAAFNIAPHDEVAGRIDKPEFVRAMTRGGDGDLQHISQRLLLNQDIVARMFRLRQQKHFIFDMDGVIYRGGELIKGVHECLAWLKATGKTFTFLTNNSNATPVMLSAKMTRLGVPTLDPELFWTAALSTAAFIKSQRPHGCNIFCVGGPGIREALVAVGMTLVDATAQTPDYVVIGEAEEYHSKDLLAATRFVHKGAILIGTNEDVADPVENGNIEPSCGAWVMVVATATGRQPYFVGKPNPLNLRSLLRVRGWHSEDCVMVGDRMSTDIRGAMEANIDSVLVLSGMTKENEIATFPFRPYLVLNNVGEIPPANGSKKKENVQ